MIMLQNKVFLTAITILALIGLSQSAHAYLDPGTGSYLFQIVIAGIMGFLFSIKLFWRNIKIYTVSLIHRVNINNVNNEK